VEFPYGFSRIQTADMIGWTGEPDHPGLVQLLAALREYLGVGRQPLAANGAIDESRHSDADLRSVGRQPLAASGAIDESRHRDADLRSVGRQPLADDGAIDESRHVDADLRSSVGIPTIIQTPPANPFIPGQTFRDTLKIGGKGPLMVVIPPGGFMMGSPPDEPERLDREGPQHQVMIKTPFALGVYAVTFADYDLFCRNTQRELPDDRDWGRDNRPVINVSWHDAQEYCAWLSGQTGHGYRLPSETEWEYACRAGTQTPFSFGGNITPEQVNYDGNYPYAGGKKGQYRKQTVPVKSLPPNAWGLYEMHGNAWEWVQDAWHGDYTGAPTDGSAWESAGTGAARVLRARGCRSAARGYGPPGIGYYGVGFRCARVQVVS
ncbi:MAG: formylglycine-generating enzyme family protein, partial [Candidatus Methylumidiphilus sp.]